jgi:hypothetical protein
LACGFGEVRAQAFGYVRLRGEQHRPAQLSEVWASVGNDKHSQLRQVRAVPSHAHQLCFRSGAVHPPRNRTNIDWAH